MHVISAPVEKSKFSAASLLAPFRAVGRFMILMAEASPKMKALTALSRTTDAELAAKGKTRDGEIRRIMGAAMWA